MIECNLFFFLNEVGNFIGVSRERARQLLGKTHKKTGYKILTNN